MKNIIEKTRLADIIFRRSGQIDIKARVADSLSISPGDCINIAIENNEYYIFIQNKATNRFGKYVGVCYPSKKGFRHFRANSKLLCATILKATNRKYRAEIAVGESSIAPDGCIRLNLITRNPLNP